jgi:hypothetical protein
MSFNPGTLYRAYPKGEKSKHYTAVLLKDGKVLEVKNLDSKIKTKYDSIELWQAAHPECSIEKDESKKSYKIGLNVPTEKCSAYIWLKWCYSIVKEAAPELLNSKKFKIAYNKMVDTCTKHKYDLICFTVISGVNRYSSENINWEGYEEYLWKGFNGYFYSEFYPNKASSPYGNVPYDRLRNPIISHYKAILDIIKPKIKKYMIVMYNLRIAQRAVSDVKRNKTRQ